MGRGVYPTVDAARIVDLDPRRIRRWVDGYAYSSPDGDARRQGPVFPREHSGETVALTFMDLVETLYVASFVRAGVSMHRVRMVHAEARAEFRVQHPFAIKRFETDGKTIFRRFYKDGSERLHDRVSMNMAVRAVFDPLMKKLDYGVADEAARYWPLGKSVPVILDPSHSFGEPVVAKSFVPTRALSAAAASGDSRERVARWYGVTLQEVSAAVSFEASLSPRSHAA